LASKKPLGAWDGVFKCALLSTSTRSPPRSSATIFPFKNVRAADVATLFDGKVGAAATKAERAIREKVGTVDVLLSGPPCQGHSDLNNHTRRRDPKNVLYLRTARVAEIFAPNVVIVENVAPVQRDETGVVKAASNALTRVGYQVAGRVVDLRRVGVPQRRRRFLLLASKVPGVNPAAVLERLAAGIPDHPDRTVGWAIRDLLGEARGGSYDSSGRVSKRNARRIAFLFDRKRYNLPNRRPKCHRGGGHSYVSMHGRLRWDRPAQTITTGFGSMGQGRYVHPARRRTITPHEAARLQTFPDSLRLRGSHVPDEARDDDRERRAALAHGRARHRRKGRHRARIQVHADHRLAAID
jgi:DNA (cytosine-5)-methyltransferase 1